MIQVKEFPVISVKAPRGGEKAAIGGDSLQTYGTRPLSSSDVITYLTSKTNCKQ